MTSHGLWTLCDGPETPTQWKSGCVRHYGLRTNQPTHQGLQLPEMLRLLTHVKITSLKTITNGAEGPRPPSHHKLVILN